AVLFEYIRYAASNGGSIRYSFTGGQFTRAVRFEAFCHVSRTAKYILLPDHQPLVGPIHPALSAAMTAEVLLPPAQQGGRTTRVDKHNMVVATPATRAHQRNQSLPSLWALCWRRWRHSD